MREASKNRSRAAGRTGLYRAGCASSVMPAQAGDPNDTWDRLVPPVLPLSDDRLLDASLCENGHLNIGHRCYHRSTTLRHYPGGDVFNDWPPTPMNRLSVAIAQMNSGADKATNISSALELIDRAAASGARLAILPEVWPYLGPEDANRENAEPIPGALTELLAERARRNGMHIHAGSMYEIEPGDPGMYNTALLFDPRGEISLATARSICLTLCLTVWPSSRSRPPSVPDMK